jgi:iron complex outermembrane receptor protein
MYADLGYQKQELDGLVDFTSVAAGVQVPDAPDNHSNYDGPNDFSHPEVLYGTLRGEVDVAKRWTAFASIGGSQRKTQYNLNQRLIVNEQGDLSGGTASSPRADRMTGTALEAGLRGSVDTGPVRHDLVMSYSSLDREWRRTQITYAFPASNIYDPVFGPPVDMSLMPDPDNLLLFQNFSSSSTVLADTLSVMEERLQLTLGARYQRMYSNFVQFAGAEFGDDLLTPMVALLVKPWERVSLYANYIEGLQEGATAPDFADNAGEGFAPFQTKQYEVGAKADLGRLGATLALYQITQPSAYTDPVTNIFGVYADQRHRGVDLNIFGEVARGVRLLGGAAFIDSELKGTAGGVDDGNRGVAVPELRLVLGAEWDTPFVPGLTLTGRVVRSDSMYIDSANSQEIPAWTRLDLGARYRISKMVIVRASLDNALDESHWDANAFGQISLNEPRTLTLSTTFSF